jgi:hypothetical protein
MTPTMKCILRVAATIFFALAFIATDAARAQDWAAVSENERELR